MPKADTSQSKVYAPPAIALASTLRPEAIARIELLRIVCAWHPNWDTGQVTKAAAELEKFVSGS